MLSPPRQLPAIRFENVAPRVDDALPRLDIAGFVGFSSAGPLDVPVPVESASAFRDVFGPDVVLAAAGDGAVRTHLGRSVEAFFANGGQVCWVVRVGEPTAPTRFALAGVVAVDAAGGWSSAQMDARSPGSFADGLSVQPVLEITGLGAADAPVSGDLLRAAYGDDLFVLGAEGADTEWWFERGTPDAGAAAFRVTPAGPQPVDLEADAPFSPGEVLVLEAANGRFVSPVETEATPTAWWRLTGTPPPGFVPDPAAPPRVERLSLTLALYEGDHLVRRLGDLALGAQHPRFPGHLPSDTELFVARGNLPEGGVGSGVVDRVPLGPELWQEAASPRFPLAGTGSAEVAWLPLGAALAPDPTRSRRPVSDVTAETAVVRNGVANFGPALFLDDDLADAGPATLVTTAEQITYLGLPGRRLRGIHALFPVEAVTMVAAPDAAHPGWVQEEVVPVNPPAAPHLFDLDEEDGGHRVRWTVVPSEPDYILEMSADPAFESARVVFRGEATTTLLPAEGCPAVVHLRVRAALSDLAGPWSNTVSDWHPPAEFGECDVLPEPLEVTLDASIPGDEHALLAWSPAHPAVEVQVSQDPGFEGEAETLTAALPGHPVAAPADAVVYYRARAVGADGPGPWSNTVSVDARPQRVWVAEPVSPAPAPVLLAVHQALLRFAAARGDLFALLSLPAGHSEPDIVTHVAALTAGAVEEEALPLSYGALYHPWVVERDGPSGTVLATPPDGWVAGTYARRALERGPWVAPANMALAGVVGLAPALGREGRRRLTEAGVNVLWREPKAFVAGTADTLSPDFLLRPVGSRRLLILLRRLALRHGDTYVFAPHDARFRALVRAQWERHLMTLFRRGAFAGATPAQAFDLRADATVNPPGSVDLGRFVVELGVAPSRPLEFIRVRVVSSGRQLSVEEVAA